MTPAREETGEDERDDNTCRSCPDHEYDQGRKCAKCWEKRMADLRWWAEKDVEVRKDLYEPVPTDPTLFRRNDKPLADEHREFFARYSSFAMSSVLEMLNERDALLFKIQGGAP